MNHNNNQQYPPHHSDHINNRILDLLDYAYNQRDRNSIFHLLVRFPNNGHRYDEDYMFQRYIATFIQNRNRKGFDCLYFWKREKYHNQLHGQYQLILFMKPQVTIMKDQLEYANQLWSSYFQYDPFEGGLAEPTLKEALVNCTHGKNGFVLARNETEFETDIVKCSYWLKGIANLRSHQFESNGHTFGMTKHVPVRDKDFNIFTKF